MGHAYYKLGQLRVITKWSKSYNLLQSRTVVITKWDNFVAKWDNYYKVGQYIFVTLG